MSLCRQNSYLLAGLFVGVTLSLLISSMENTCSSLPAANSAMELADDYVDEYEPRINLAGKPQKAKKTPQALVRPRYYSTELGIREKLFVAVLSSQETINSRGVALNKTVAHLVDKIMYFIDAPGPQKLNLSMSGIVGFTDTRKLLKPFHVLKYVADNFLDEYDFFFIVKDSTYVKARTLYEVVQGISVSQEVHAGSEKEDEHTAFCTLDAGVLLSNSVLRKVHASLDWCVKNAFSESATDNVGRCILHATDIPCKSSVQGLNLLTHRTKKPFNLNSELQSLAKKITVDKIITMYPVPEPAAVYSFHAYFSKVALTATQLEIAARRSAVLNMSYIAPGGRSGVAWPVGATPGNRPASRFDVLRWDYFTLSHIYPESDFSNLKELVGADKQDVEYVLNATVAWMHTKYEGLLQYRRLINGYRRFDPSRGLDYKVDLAFRDTTNGHEVHKRLEVSKPLGKVEVVPVPYVTENTRVSLVLPVTMETKPMVADFLQQYNNICMEKKDKTFLMLVLMYDPRHPGKGNKDDTFLELKQTAVKLSDRHKRDGGKIAWVSVKLPDSQQAVHVTRGLLDFAAADLAIRKLSQDSLVFFVRPNAELRQDLINRVRMNTIQHIQAFSPIPFSEFHPDIVYNSDLPRPSELDINKSYGHYDTQSTAFISFYASDYLRARKSIENYLPMMQSDKDLNVLVSIASSKTTNTETLELFKSLAENTLYSLFLRASDLHILRAVEPGLRLRHVPLDCTSSGSASEISLHMLEACIKARANNLGSRSALARLLLEFQSSAVSSVLPA